MRKGNQMKRKNYFELCVADPTSHSTIQLSTYTESCMDREVLSCMVECEVGSATHNSK